MKSLFLSLVLIGIFVVGCGNTTPSSPASVDYTYHVVYAGTGPVSIQYLPDYPSNPLVLSAPGSPTTWTHGPVSIAEKNAVWLRVQAQGLSPAAAVSIWVSDASGNVTKATSGLSYDSGSKSYLLIVAGNWDF